MATLEQTFHCVTDFVSHVTGPEVLSPRFISDRTNDAEWYGVDKEQNYREPPGMTVLRLVHDGWPAGARLMAKVENSVYAPPAKSIRRRLKWHDQGDEINMQRVYAGNLDQAWQATTKQVSSGPTRIRIVVDSIAIAWESAESMRWRGVAAMKLADILTSAGYTVQVESAFYGLGGGDGRLDSGKRLLRVVVKPYSSPLDLETLAATTALPGFFRALGHAWSGGSMSVPQLEPDHVKDSDDKNSWTVIIPQSVKDIPSASAQIKQTMQEIEALHSREFETLH